MPKYSDRTALRLKLKANSFSPLPVHGKFPPMAGWQNLHDVPVEKIERWERTWPNAGNTGIITQRNPAFDIDIMHAEAAEAVEALVYEMFGERGRLLIRVGQAPKRAILLRTEAPFAKTKRLFVAPDGSKHKIEILCDGQQVVVHGIHPDTKRPYTWTGGEPWTVNRNELPGITEVDALAFLDDASELLEQFEFQPTTDKKTDAKDGEPSHDWEELISKILSGEDLHDSIVSLAAKMITAGMAPGAAVNQIRALMNACPAPRDGRWQERYDDIPRAVSSAQEKFAQKSDALPSPVDLWANFSPPELPTGLLPEVIEKFARIEGAAMGADPAGLAMAALTVCGAAISDEIELQPKRHANWKESARIWASLVGDPSTMKTPIINQTAWPLKRIDKTLFQQYLADLEAYNDLTLEERKKTEPPKQRRVRIEDTTIEAAQEVLKDSPDGVLCLQDELSGWFGMMDRYAGNRGGMKDRGFWLQAFNGGEYVVNRIQRGALFIPNLSVSLLGGIQPDPMRKLAADTVDDGLLQRTCPIVLTAATMGRDEPADPINAEYGKLIDALHEMNPPRAGSDGNYFLLSNALRFDDDAQVIRSKLEQKHLDLQNFEAVSKKLSAHIGKYNGIFARLCVIFHCIEYVGRELPITITADTAERVAKFLHDFLLPHAVAFYAGVLGLSDDHDRLAAVAGYILAHKLDKITNRDIQRGDRTMRGLTKRDTERVFEQLDALGWISRIESKRLGSAPQWVVNPEVHRLFQERAKKEAARRSSIRAVIAGAVPRRHEY
jgi:Protein of unknown function (DUF3987)/Bifunctional DNA primase/polymerase, N-terminal